MRALPGLATGLDSTFFPHSPICCVLVTSVLQGGRGGRGLGTCQHRSALLRLKPDQVLYRNPKETLLMTDNRTRLSSSTQRVFLASSHKLPRRGCISSFSSLKDFRIPHSHIRKHGGYRKQTPNKLCSGIPTILLRQPTSAPALKRVSELAGPDKKGEEAGA